MLVERRERPRDSGLEQREVTHATRAAGLFGQPVVKEENLHLIQVDRHFASAESAGR